MGYLRYLLLFLCLILRLDQSRADKITGRLEAGGFVATERFQDETSGSANNDFALGTFRLFFKDTGVFGSGFDFNLDVRDKYDFFDKLNKEKYRLDASNVVTVHQLNVSKPIKKNSGWGFVLGRQSVLEAGGAYADGLLLNRKASSAWNLGAFAGLDPKTPGQTRIDFDSSASIYGGFFSFQPSLTSWDKNFFISHSYVTQASDGQVSRQYLYQSMNYQWAKNDRLITLLYLDFVPRTFVQVGSVNYYQDISERIFTKTSLLGVDSLGYVRIQNVREELESSPYHQGQFRVGYRIQSKNRIELSGLYGRRVADSLEKTVYALTFTSLEIFGPKWDTQWTAGYRNNFISVDQYAAMRLGYYSRRWEYYLDAEAGFEKYKKTKNTLHPLVVEFSSSWFLSRSTYITGSFQRAADENVEIFSTFVKLGYRFGAREIPPLREGSPERGVL